MNSLALLASHIHGKHSCHVSGEQSRDAQNRQWTVAVGHQQSIPKGPADKGRALMAMAIREITETDPERLKIK